MAISFSKRRCLLLPICASLAMGSGCHTINAFDRATDQPFAAGSYEQEQQYEQQQEAEEGLFTVAADAVLYPFYLFYIDVLAKPVDRYEGRTPAFYARMMDEGKTPDQRRRGMAELVTRYDFTHRPPYTQRYKQLAQGDPDYTVRAMAIRALNICRDRSATPIFIAALDDPDELVRLEAAKALANVPDPAAIQPLLRMIEGRLPPALAQSGDVSPEAKDVRIAAADALRHYRNLDVARTLVNVLNERDFGVAWQSRRSLIAMTGRDMRYDQGAWLMYLASMPFG